MIAIFDKESTWFLDETKMQKEYKKLLARDFKEAYMGWFVNDTSTCEIIGKMPVSRFYIDRGNGELMELSKEEAIHAYQLFDEQFNKGKNRSLFK